MVHVSTGALVSLVIIMLICFVMPFALFYILYRYADCKVKTLITGAAAYIACGVIADTIIAASLDRIGGINGNSLLYLLHVTILSPVLFILINYLVIRKFGADNMNTTGDSMMYALGYSSAFNILSTGLIAIMYFLTLIDIRDNSEKYLVVSDANYVSASGTVSGSNVVNESIYKEMINLCSKPVSYYMNFIINCLWVIAAYAAIMLVIWLAVKKSEKVILLAFAFVIRLFSTLPDILQHFNMIKNTWVSHLISIVILVIIWTAAVFCRKTFIDRDDAVKGE